MQQNQSKEWNSTIWYWMVEELKLGGNELLIYAYIHSFGDKGFYGSEKTIGTKLGCSRQTVSKTISKFVKEGLILKNGDSLVTKREHGDWNKFKPTKENDVRLSEQEIKRFDDLFNDYPKDDQNREAGLKAYEYLLRKCGMSTNDIKHGYLLYMHSKKDKNGEIETQYLKNIENLLLSLKGHKYKEKEGGVDET